MTVLRIADLVAGYEADVPIVRGASLSIAQLEHMATMPRGARRTPQEFEALAFSFARYA